MAACVCGRAHAQHPSPQPGGPAAAGDPPSLRSRALGAGAALLQSKAPLNAMDLYLNGFHFYADDMGRPVEAHHFCTHLTEDLHQCTIFDSNDGNARLIGVEYIISERLFQQLPEDEKPLWHSHHYETTSGQLVMPGIPEAVETEAMRMLAGTYGKTWHTWQVDRGDTLPLGIPQLMMGYTRDGQLDPQRVEERDRRLGVSVAESRRARAGIQAPQPAPGANAWESGQTPQLSLQTVPVRNRR
ncbi:OBAP family protein [Roseomonas marmotae]|uniref:OBAP family protein n=2 Tax=Roseomonas marmotae TaxID=2768161 RepID=A0ABS3KB79_9PROT|nr:OBAP family protein [Roseomonas marmotae]QTI80893.1 OBAP family protein [Roseomonas marmotae]